MAGAAGRWIQQCRRVHCPHAPGPLAEASTASRLQALAISTPHCISLVRGSPFVLFKLASGHFATLLAPATLPLCERSPPDLYSPEHSSHMAPLRRHRSGRPERWDTTQGAGPYIRRWRWSTEQILRLWAASLTCDVVPAGGTAKARKKALVGAADGLHKGAVGADFGPGQITSAPAPAGDVGRVVVVGNNSPHTRPSACHSSTSSRDFPHRPLHPRRQPRPLSSALSRPRIRAHARACPSLRVAQSYVPPYPFLTSNQPAADDSYQRNRGLDATALALSARTHARSLAVASTRAPRLPSALPSHHQTIAKNRIRGEDDVSKGLLRCCLCRRCSNE